MQTLHVYFYLAYRPLKFRSIFDYCREMAGPIKSYFATPVALVLTADNS